MARTKQGRMDRGQQARNILEAPLFVEAMDYILGDANRRLMAAGTPDEAWLALTSFRAALHQRSVLEAYVRDGENAAKQAQAEESDAKHEIAVQEYMKRAREARAEYEKETGNVQ